MVTWWNQWCSSPSNTSKKHQKKNQDLHGYNPSRCTGQRVTEVTRHTETIPTGRAIAKNVTTKFFMISKHRFGGFERVILQKMMNRSLIAGKVNQIAKPFLEAQPGTSMVKTPLHKNRWFNWHPTWTHPPWRSDSFTHSMICSHGRRCSASPWQPWIPWGLISQPCG